MPRPAAFSLALPLTEFRLARNAQQNLCHFLACSQSCDMRGTAQTVTLWSLSPTLRIPLRWWDMRVAFSPRPSLSLLKCYSPFKLYFFEFTDFGNLSFINFDFRFDSLDNILWTFRHGPLIIKHLNENLHSTWWGFILCILYSDVISYWFYYSMLSI